MITRLLQDDDGGDIIEYAILILLVAIAFVEMIPALRDAVSTAFFGFAATPYDLWVPNDPQP